MHATEVYAQICFREFPNQRQIIFNIKQIFSLLLFLFLALHLAACLNIFQGTASQSWISTTEEGDLID